MSLNGAYQGSAADQARILAGNMGLRPRRTDRLHRSGNTHDVDHALQVICEHVQAHFGAHVDESPRQEMRRTHPVLQCSLRSAKCPVFLREFWRPDVRNGWRALIAGRWTIMRAASDRVRLRPESDRFHHVRMSLIGQERASTKGRFREVEGMALCSRPSR